MLHCVSFQSGKDCAALKKSRDLRLFADANGGADIFQERIIDIEARPAKVGNCRLKVEQSCFVGQAENGQGAERRQPATAGNGTRFEVVHENGNMALLNGESNGLVFPRAANPCAGIPLQSNSANCLPTPRPAAAFLGALIP
jgi:hypothetical protein